MHSRRGFLQRSLQGVVGWGAGWMCLSRPLHSANAADRPGAPPIIDTHQHLWDLDVLPPPWLQTAPQILNRSYVTADYQRATEGLNIARAVYMEVDVAPDRQIEEADRLIELCHTEKQPTVAAVISGRPNSPEFAAYIRRYADSPYIKGVRQVLQVPETPKGLCLQPQFIQSVRLLGELRLSFDLCMRPTELSDGQRLARECPDTRLIVDHCGNADPKAFLSDRASSEEPPWHEPNQWKRDMADLAAQPNVVCKISGIVARATEDWTPEQLAPIIIFCLDEFGPDRVMFGSDWPVCLLRSSLRGWVEALEGVISQRPAADQHKLLHDNAARFYGLH